MISCIVLMRSFSPVITGTSKMTPHKACGKFKFSFKKHYDIAEVAFLTCFSVNLAVNLRLAPSLRYSGWGLSRMMKTMSAGIFPGVWSPKKIDNLFINCTETFRKILLIGFQQKHEFWSISEVFGKIALHRIKNRSHLPSEMSPLCPPSIPVAH